jgi:hypothetical protein
MIHDIAPITHTDAPYCPIVPNAITHFGMRVGGVYDRKKISNGGNEHLPVTIFNFGNSQSGCR